MPPLLSHSLPTCFLKHGVASISQLLTGNPCLHQQSRWGPTGGGQRRLPSALLGALPECKLSHVWVRTSGVRVSYENGAAKVSLLTHSEALGWQGVGSRGWRVDHAHTSPLPQKLSYSCKQGLRQVQLTKISLANRTLSTRGDKELLHTSSHVLLSNQARHQRQTVQWYQREAPRRPIFSTGQWGTFVQSFPETTSSLRRLLGLTNEMQICTLLRWDE